ncbi:oligosaccharide flippase family protein [Alsobacter sp. KACC 23698]|uniref:Oligosaccharide flippase family protein n=1 Tax=Alsobacter sp. KACC 23698 TaxID=3149229 RepID=A0AAU7JJ52_9HYPH
MIGSHAFWTVLGFATSLLIRLGTSVIVSRILYPDALGVMVILNSLRTGIELLSDIGIEQNIVHHKGGLAPAFYDTAFTLQIIRGILLSFLFVVASIPLSRVYSVDVKFFFAMSVVPFVNSLTSTAVFAAVKTLDVRRRNLFEVSSEFLASICAIVFAIAMKSVWSLIFAAIVGTAIRAFLSYFLPFRIPKLRLVHSHVTEILSFGRWIVFASLLSYLASNVDRLIIGSVDGLTALGVYGLARTIADLPASLAGRVAYQLLFPHLSRHRDPDGSEYVFRWQMMLQFGSAIFIAIACSWADFVIRCVYDQRYGDAAWMLSILLFGAWFNVVATLNEASLLSAGVPSNMGAASATKLGVLLSTIFVLHNIFGLEGAVMAIAVSEICRSLLIAVRIKKIEPRLFLPTVAAHVIFCSSLLAQLGIRHLFGLGTPLSAIQGIRSW